MLNEPRYGTSAKILHIPFSHLSFYLSLSSYPCLFCPFCLDPSLSYPYLSCHDLYPCLCFSSFSFPSCALGHPSTEKVKCMTFNTGVQKDQLRNMVMISLSFRL